MWKWRSEYSLILGCRNGGGCQNGGAPTYYSKTQLKVERKLWLNRRLQVGSGVDAQVAIRQLLQLLAQLDVMKTPMAYLHRSNKPWPARTNTMSRCPAEVSTDLVGLLHLHITDKLTARLRLFHQPSRQWQTWCQVHRYCRRKLSSWSPTMT